MSEAYLSLHPHSTLLNTGFEIDPNKQQVQVCFTQRGIDVHIPPARFVWRGVRRSFWRGVNKVGEAFYPIPLPLLLATAVGSTVYVYSCSSNSYLLTHPVVVWLRYIDSLNPLSKLVAERYQPTILCVKVWTAAVAATTVVHRFLLRRLLKYTGWMLEDPGEQPSLRTKLWMLALRAVSHPSINKTDVYERCLPNLPLPSLQSTVGKYLSSMRSVYHQDGADLSDWMELRRAAESFLLNEGPTLQRHLRLHHVVSVNYVSEWWTRNVFLSARQSLCLYSNYYAVPFASYTPTNVPEARAAVLTYYLLQLRKKIDRRVLSPDFGGPHGCVPLTMHQYRLAFNTTRIPGREIDLLEHDEEDTNTYVVVLYAGRIYQVLTEHPVTHAPLTPHQLEGLFRSILDEVEEEVSTSREESEDEVAEEEKDDKAQKRRSYQVAEGLLPALTTAPRAEWADIRSAFLLHDPNNRQPLRIIEKAMFVISLDEDIMSHRPASTGSPSRDLSTECGQYLCGNGSNIWCDKSFNVMIRADGRVGVHVEHAWGDLWTFLSLFRHVTSVEKLMAPYDDDGHAKLMDGDGTSSGIQRVSSLNFSHTFRHINTEEDLLEPKRLRFTIHKKLAKSIRDAHTSFLTNIASQLDIFVLPFTSYGHNLPQSVQCSPDSWMQMAIQLAHYRNQHGHLSQIYQSVSHRVFGLGRTEAVRSTCDESAALVQLLSPDLAGTEGLPVAAEVEADHMELLRRCCQRHTTAVHEAMAGLAADRHLFALYMMSAGKQVPSDFLNAVLRKTKWKVSTANASQQLDAGSFFGPRGSQPFVDQPESPACGFGPAASDGYGVSYAFCGEMIYVTITCFKDSEKTSAKTFGRFIAEALEELGKVATSTSTSTSPSSPAPVLVD